MSCGSSNNAGQLAQQQQQQQENLTNQSIAGIDKAFSGFTPDFYKGVGTAYQNYAMPQLQQQYKQTADALNFKLAGQGLGQSSVATQLGNQLSQANSAAETQVGNQAVSQEQQLQQQVANEKSNLYQQAQTATNPSQIATQAVAQAGSLSGPSTFQPLGQLFNNFATTYLVNQLGNQYYGFANQYLNTTNNPGLYNTLGGTSTSGALPGSALYQ